MRFILRVRRGKRYLTGHLGFAYMILNNKKERTRFLRFIVVGAIGFVVDFGTFNLLTSFLRVPPVLASVFSFAAAIVSNFLWNRFWTYPDSRSKGIVRQLMEFGVVSVTGLLIRTPIFALLEAPLRKVFESISISWFLTPELLGYNLALATAVVVVMFWNFFINRYWTYADVD